MIYICRGCCNTIILYVWIWSTREIFLIVKPAANLVIPNTQISISTKIDLLYSYFAMCILSAPHFTHFKTKTLECTSLHINHLNSYYRLFILLAAARKGPHYEQEEKGINSGHFNSHSEKLFWSSKKFVTFH